MFLNVKRTISDQARKLEGSQHDSRTSLIIDSDGYISTLTPFKAIFYSINTATKRCAKGSKHHDPYNTLWDFKDNSVMQICICDTNECNTEDFSSVLRCFQCEDCVIGGEEVVECEEGEVCVSEIRSNGDGEVIGKKCGDKTQVETDLKDVEVEEDGCRTKDGAKVCICDFDRCNSGRIPQPGSTTSNPSTKTTKPSTQPANAILPNTILLSTLLTLTPKLFNSLL